MQFAIWYFLCKHGAGIFAREHIGNDAIFMQQR